jgi:GH25 family lysozyme M1 (1,4-beta-N-acetylmuramidase)
MTVLGLDLSHYQGLPDFSEVKSSGYEFCILKSSEGINVIDGGFSLNRERAVDAGLIVGAYHFARPSESSGKAQAEFLLRILNAHTVSNVWLDIETTGGLDTDQLRGWCAEFLATLRAGFKGKVGAYCGQSYASTLGGVLFLDGDGAWIASPNYRPRTTFNIWQDSWVTRVPSISGPADQDEYDGTLPEFRVFLGLDKPVVTPGPPEFRFTDFLLPLIAASYGKVSDHLGHAALFHTALDEIGIRAHADGDQFGPRDVKAYAQYQRELGYTGAMANGIPGVVSFTKLTDTTKLWTLK